MKKEVREIVRIAEAEGIQDCRYIHGDPHGRLVGTYQGKPWKMVATISQGKVLRHTRGLKSFRSNIRQAIRSVSHG